MVAVMLMTMAMMIVMIISFVQVYWHFGSKQSGFEYVAETFSVWLLVSLACLVTLDRALNLADLAPFALAVSGVVSTTPPTTTRMHKNPTRPFLTKLKWIDYFVFSHLFLLVPTRR